jgi:hypothetical protein
VNVVVVTLIDNVIHYNRDSVVEISNTVTFYWLFLVNTILLVKRQLER